MDTPSRTLQPIQVGEREAARVLGVCAKTLYNLRRAGKIAYVRVGLGGNSRVAYRLDELDRFSRENQVTVASSQQ